MSLLAVDIASTGLHAQRIRMQAISTNLANIHTTKGPDGRPFQRQVPIFRADSLDGSFQADLDEQQRLYGVRVEKVVNAQREPILVYNPDHPDANEEGFVAMPNINIVEETTDMLNAARSYEANLAVLTTAKSMVRSALDLGKA